MSHTANTLIFSHYHFRDSIIKQKYGKALRYFEIFLNAHDRLEASAKAHTQQQVTQHNADKKMTSKAQEQNTVKGFGERVLILETDFNKVHTKGTYVIITDKDDNNVVIMDINELDSVYNIIHTTKE